jgi:hypothetical protein
MNNHNRADALLCMGSVKIMFTVFYLIIMNVQEGSDHDLSQGTHKLLSQVTFWK